MKIKIDKIKTRIVNLKEEIPASSWEMDSADIKFVDNIELSCRFEMIGNEILVDANLIARYQISCSRCLEQVIQTENRNFKKSYNTEDLEDCLDIDGDLREEMLLAFPMKVLCDPSCKGLCSVCGLKLNVGKCECQKNGADNKTQYSRGVKIDIKS